MIIFSKMIIAKISGPLLVWLLSWAGWTAGLLTWERVRTGRAVASMDAIRIGGATIFAILLPPALSPSRGVELLTAVGAGAVFALPELADMLGSLWLAARHAWLAARRSRP